MCRRLIGRIRLGVVGDLGQFFGNVRSHEIFSLYLSKQIGEPECVSKKHGLMNHKAELESKSEGERNRAYRFELSRGG